MKIAALFGLLIAAAPARAQLDLSAGLHAGTNGIGVEGDLLLTGHFGVRAAYNGVYSYTTTKANSGITWDGKWAPQNIPLLLDIYTSARGLFHFTGGIVLNQNKITATGVPDASGNFVIGGTTYNQSYLGGPPVLALTYPSTAWYAGLGWGSPVKHKSNWGFVCDIGVMGATPKVDITVPDPMANAAIHTELQAQIDSTNANLKKYATYWPVIQIGVNYKF